MVHTVRKTDRDGRARIILFRHTSRDTLNIDVWAQGYVQQRHFFSQNDARYPKVPARVTIDLLPGEQTLGGRVTDEKGQPIDGVKVDIWGYLGEKKQKEELAFMVDAITDDQGRWRCRCFRDMQFAYLYLSHPDYLADDNMHPRRHGRPRPADPPQPDEKPMAAAARLLRHPGSDARGRGGWRGPRRTGQAGARGRGRLARSGPESHLPP